MEVNELAVKEILDELNDVKLIAATKYVGIDEINKLENLGVMYFGENRVQAFLEKYQKYNLLEVEKNHLKLTEKGILLSNEIMSEFID